MSDLDSERRWQAMGNLICEAEKFYLRHGGEREWAALMDETNRILDIDDATLLDNLSERRPTEPSVSHRQILDADGEIIPGSHLAPEPPASVVEIKAAFRAPTPLPDPLGNGNAIRGQP
jgi:hypothetical protein